MRFVSKETRDVLRKKALARGAVPPSRKGAKHSLETRLKMSVAKTKHGKTPLRQCIRNSYETRQWRNDIFRRDDYTCVLCGIRSAKGITVYLQADHFPKTFAVILEEYDICSMEEARACAELWDTNNGRTLCTPCHLDETRKLYKV